MAKKGESPVEKPKAAKVTPTSKVAAPKPAKATKNATVLKRVSKGDTVVCEICGLAVEVIEVGGIAVSHEDVLVCCGKPMKARKKKPAAVEK